MTELPCWGGPLDGGHLVAKAEESPVDGEVYRLEAPPWPSVLMVYVWRSRHHRLEYLGAESWHPAGHEDADTLSGIIGRRLPVSDSSRCPVSGDSPWLSQAWW